MVQKSFKLIKIWLSHQRDKRGQILNKKKIRWSWFRSTICYDDA